MRRPRHGLALLAALALPSLASAYDGPVRKRALRLADFRFESGETIPELRLGYETYGQLNAARDNVVLICHFFMGDGHAAGKYSPSDATPGWWDELIGDGLAIDTRRYFVVSTDLPCGMQVKRDTVITTGPRSLDPRTGVPYGPRFPRTTLRDYVAAQRAVLDVLGVRRLRLITGPSMGGMLALQWAVTRPDEVDQVLAVSAPIEFSAVDRAGFQASAAAIRSDPLWLLGDYLRFGVEPDYGVAMALHGLLALSEGDALWIPWRWQSYLDDARGVDANHYLQTLGLHTDYTLGAEHGSQAAGLRRIRADVILLGSRDDEFITPEELEDAEQTLRAARVRAQRVLFDGTNGHLSCLEDQGAFAPVLSNALR
ncbi:MAG: alpha/beta fold hydrolase [Planctomycetes bacterium]|nr:alpha/beta fold hydrolase [Planctomycetota bacterium]